MVNPYDRCNRVKPDIELIERQPSSVKFVSPFDRTQKSVIEEIEELAEVRPNWLTPKRVVELYYDILTPYEHSEIISYPQVYFIGSKAASLKRAGNFSMGSKFGYDDAKGSYLHVTHDHVAYRYEILRVLGKGSFGQVLKVFDHKTKQFAALKIVRNERRFLQQAKKEVKILEHILKEDEENTANMVHIMNSFIFRGHACIVFELMSINMYELIKKNKFLGFTVRLVRNFAHSILIALNLLHNNKIIHGDLKPENIVLKQPEMSGIKVIDFGNSWYEGTSVQPGTFMARFYTAPEVILGSSYGTAIDMWSLGCILAELLMGFPILSGENYFDQMAMMIELLGIPPEHLLKGDQRTSKRSQMFFSSNGTPRYCRVTDNDTMNKGGKSRRGKYASRGPPGSRDLGTALRGSVKVEDSMVVDFIRKCLEWDPKHRMTPEMALRHSWLRKRERFGKNRSEVLTEEAKRNNVTVAEREGRYIGGHNTCGECLFEGVWAQC
eukprot:GFUD01036453.1.p1 GENE.GFUD01036453.1~~GFUD01036453.1.p1  ORF type:complete len:570 (+),score=80.98 GFUD01036453.1:226-1710(+)